MFHGKCSRRPFTVSGQKGTEQRSCHLFSLKFETLLYSRVRVSSTKKREKCPYKCGYCFHTLKKWLHL